MSDVIEGRNAVLEALRAGRRITRLLVAEGVRPGEAVDEAVRLAAAAGVRTDRVPRAELDRMSPHGAHQGVVAVAESFSYASLDDVLRVVGEAPSALVIVLDHVLDPGNLGAVVRSAAAAGASGVIVPDRRSAPMSTVALKAAAGAAERLPIARVANVAQTLERLKDAGFWIAGADAGAAEDAWTAPLDGRLALVLGSEGRGLARLTAERCDFLVTIPMAAGVESLNVAQAATVLAFEWRRRRASTDRA